MRAHATAQALGTRSHQCDATAVYTAPNGARAYVLLDGIGSTDEVREWTREAARRVARAAARRGDAETGLRAVYNRYAAEKDRHDPFLLHYLPSAAAVVVVTAPGRPVTVAWCGDSRAYVLARGTVRLLTTDHNLRRVYRGGNRNSITSFLGAPHSDEERRHDIGHPAIETTSFPAEDCRLLLASDGAYEPHEDAGHDLAGLLVGDAPDVAKEFVTTAVAQSIATSRDPEDPHADNATVLVADLRP